MRILFDSKKTCFKSPFGTLAQGQECTLHIHIPSNVGATACHCILTPDDGGEVIQVALSRESVQGAYDIFGGTFALDRPALYFYHFVITKNSSSFRLFKYGDDTNMEAGDQWQLTCTPKSFTTPDWANGAVIYQVFPDRFAKSGSCDLTGKLQPYTVHENWNEEVAWQPTPEGLVLNNDFYGGNFRGITEKMDYIASLGTTILYLNPISKSFSSHRYDTGDYKTPDPMLGSIQDFRDMCQAAHQQGIKVILDGVYSHTGSDSLYFNKAGTFDSLGAYQSPDSPYYSWFTFYQYPNSYNCWWNFDTLPTVKKLDPAFVDYIIQAKESVVAYWLEQGCDGFRLDVADELPNEFMDMLKKRIREIRPDALLLGEVWEDASNKEAYGVRRRYFVDGTLDSVMNYPFRTAILQYLKGADDGAALRETVMTVLENYPPQVVHCNMNLLGTHDTPRILTALVDDFNGSREEMARRHLSHDMKKLAMARFLLASVLQYTLPGSPSLYYGDEAGMEGGKDPFNRRTYPWGMEDKALLQHFCKLGSLKKHPALSMGDTQFLLAEGGKVAFRREAKGKSILVYTNHSPERWEIPAGHVLYSHGLAEGELASMGFAIVEA